ncbi:MAG: hypothetical protein A2Y95_00750 [Deltaproteobacteria bacterium RBG_13_65_10]|nr:MAG: hypothetical protein A2Y95_00750 [Deltaproteobacteria bacterium RBG_13_65_10]
MPAHGARDQVDHRLALERALEVLGALTNETLEHLGTRLELLDVLPPQARAHVEREGEEHLVGERAALGEKRLEPSAVQAQELRHHLRRHRGRARAPFEQRKLTHDGARIELGHRDFPAALGVSRDP